MKKMNTETYTRTEYRVFGKKTDGTWWGLCPSKTDEIIAVEFMNEYAHKAEMKPHIYDKYEEYEVRKRKVTTICSEWE